MRLVIVEKQQLNMLIILAVSVVIIAVSAVGAGQKRLLPIYSVENNEKHISLTFDAAWGNAKKVQNIN